MSVIESGKCTVCGGPIQDGFLFLCKQCREENKHASPESQGRISIRDQRQGLQDQSQSREARSSDQGSTSKEEEMSSDNPCNTCKADNCDYCILAVSSKGQCYNYDCMVNHGDCGCLLGMDDKCKASTCYVNEQEDEE